METSNQRQCACEKSSCGCRGAKIETCACGADCGCGSSCKCARGCDCAGKKPR